MLRLPAGARIFSYHSVQTNCRTNPTTTLHFTAVERSLCTVTPAIGAVEIFGYPLGQAWHSFAVAREDTWSWCIRINRRHEKKYYDASWKKLLLYRKIARARGKKPTLSYKWRSCAQPMLGVILNFRPLDSFIMSQLALNILHHQITGLKSTLLLVFSLKLNTWRIIWVLADFSWDIR